MRCLNSIERRPHRTYSLSCTAVTQSGGCCSHHCGGTPLLRSGVVGLVHSMRVEINYVLLGARGAFSSRCPVGFPVVKPLWSVFGLSGYRVKIGPEAPTHGAVCTNSIFSLSTRHSPSSVVTRSGIRAMALMNLRASLGMGRSEEELQNVGACAAFGFQRNVCATPECCVSLAVSPSAETKFR